VHATPSALFHRHTDSFLNNLNGALDGDIQSVHQARIATRRLREILPVVGGDLEDVMKTVRSAGRQLGKVRELDVMCTLLGSLGSRIPTTAAADLHRGMQALRARRVQARRAMIKSLERLDFSPLHDARANAAKRWQWIARLHERNSGSAQIWDRVVERSRQAADAVTRARAVYFPNRAHHARVAIKKLRYACEVLVETGLWHADAALKDLRRLQGALGDVHDLQVLDDTLAELATAEHVAPEPSAVRLMLESDLDRRYADYVGRRERIFALADACARAAERQGRWRLPTPLIAASVITAPIFIESMRPARRPQRPRIVSAV